MSTEVEQARQIAQKCYELFKQGNIDEIHDQYMAEDIVLKVPLNLADPAASGEAPFETQGRDEVREFFQGWTKLFDFTGPDVEKTIVDGSGNEGVYIVCVVNTSITCKATGKAVQRQEVHINLFKDGKLKLFQNFSDVSGTLRIMKED